MLDHWSTVKEVQSVALAVSLLGGKANIPPLMMKRMGVAIAALANDTRVKEMLDLFVMLEMIFAIDVELFVIRL